METKQFGNVIAHWDEVIRTHRLNAEAYISRGIVHRQNKEFDKAIFDYSEAIALDPKSSLAHNNRAWLWSTS